MIAQRLSGAVRAEKDENERWDGVSTVNLKEGFGSAVTPPTVTGAALLGRATGAENHPDPPWESGLTRSRAGHGGPCAHSLRSPVLPLGSELGGQGDFFF